MLTLLWEDFAEQKEAYLGDLLRKPVCMLLSRMRIEKKYQEVKSPKLFLETTVFERGLAYIFLT